MRGSEKKYNFASMRTIANITSVVFHPLLMITYGMILALSYTYLAIYPLSIRGLIMGGVFFSTAFVPGLFIFLMVKTGTAKDLELSDRRERTLPYIILITSNIACLFFLYKMMMPLWILGLLIAAILALVVSMCINFFWKISAHMLGIGGLLGGVMGISQVQMRDPQWVFIAGILAAGMLGVARIYLRKHTPLQVYAGFLLGFAFTFIASLLSYIYLFI